MRDPLTEQLEHMLNAALPFIRKMEQRRERERRARQRESARRLRNRDAVPEPRAAKPLPGQRTLFDARGAEG